MSCLGGTVESPQPWIRFTRDGEVRLRGRWCDRQQPFTSRRSCSSCPAYRGVRWDGTRATGAAPNGDIIALSESESRQLEAAREAAFEDDDFSLMRAFYDRLEGGIGERTMRENGDPDAGDRWAAYMRGYRERMNAEQRDRQRRAKREYMREYMKKRRAVVSVSTPGTSRLGQ